MTERRVEAKICGVSSRDALDAAAEGGARYVGFVFYPPSPRSLTPEAAGDLARSAPAGILRIGLFVDADDATIQAVLAAAPLDMLQFHGKESPARVAAAKARFGLPVMKAIPVAAADDLAVAAAFFGVADRLLFDAKPPKDMKGALPGGNALSFDWELLAGRVWPLPWMLSGGLDADNVGRAIRIARPPAVDVSSGVESAPGRKDPDRIRAFLRAVAAC